MSASDPAERPLLLLWGFMGTGKSSAGKLVAARAGVQFADLDEAIVRVEDASIAEIFAREGETWFRTRERVALGAVLDSGGAGVVALGGGALCDEALRARALREAFVVTLTASPETLLARTAGSGRPLLQAPDPAAVLRSLLGARESAYRSAHACVSSEGLTVTEVADRLLSLWRPAR